MEMPTPEARRAELTRLVRRIAALPLVLVTALAAVGGWEAAHGDPDERPLRLAILAALLAAGGLGVFTYRHLRRLLALYEAAFRRDEQASRELRESLAQLQAAVAVRDRFLSIASHELKTPLASLRLQLDGAGRALPAGADERAARRLGQAVASVGRLAALVDRLLDVTHIARGTPELLREPVDLAELAREAVEQLEEPLRASGSAVALEAPAPVVGDWDRLRIASVATNLLANAVKYGRGRPIAVGVRQEGSEARLWVRDQGIGIAPADQGRIFERYERAVTERQYGGFGLGLWVARLVAEAHGGTVTVESREGEGATFTLVLPVSPASTAG